MRRHTSNLVGISVRSTLKVLANSMHASQVQLHRLNEIGCGLIFDNVGYQSLPLQKLR